LPIESFWLVSAPFSSNNLTADKNNQKSANVCWHYIAGYETNINIININNNNNVAPQNGQRHSKGACVNFLIQ